MNFMDEKIPIQAQRFQLPFKCVSIACLDVDQNVLLHTNASGFILQEEERLFLYTCWHVVTGYNPSDIRIGRNLPNRRYIRIAIQKPTEINDSITKIGGRQEIILPLYQDVKNIQKPLWYQDKLDIKHDDLNAIGIKVPALHDVVKIPLPEDFKAHEFQIISSSQFLTASTPSIGEKTLIVGYPYGYSTKGDKQPTPIVLTRFIAATPGLNFLLESTGAPGMSGGPVFLESERDIMLFGIYTGIIYPDFEQNQNEKTTALGQVVDIGLIQRSATPLRPYDD